MADPDGNDLISKLPDDVLVSIISRTSPGTEEAVRTSILSKRWKNLYKFVPSIYFYCPDHDNAISHIYKFLQLHSGSIRYFNCICCLKKSSSQHIFEQCIYALGILGIEKFILNPSCNWEHSGLSFSFHLISHMPSLRYLGLSYCSLLPDLKSRFCHSLKTLRLCSVRLYPVSLECVLSSCLSLDTLLIRCCECPPKLSFCGTNLQLKCLMILSCKGVEAIELHACNLVVFQFCDSQMVNFVFDYVPQLQNVVFRIVNQDVTPYVFGRFGEYFPKLKSLIFESPRDLYKDFSIPLSVNMFGHLEQLELGVWCILKIDLLSLTRILHRCPLLQDLYLILMSDVKYNGGTQEEKCVIMQPHLKNVNICGFGGTENEMEFARYILESAPQLEKMSIARHADPYSGYDCRSMQFSPKWSEVVYKNIQQLLTHEAASKTVQVIIQQVPPLRYRHEFIGFGSLETELESPTY